MIQRLIPNIFYERLDDGLDLFVAGLGFKVLHKDESLAVVSQLWSQSLHRPKPGICRQRPARRSPSNP